MSLPYHLQRVLETLTPDQAAEVLDWMTSQSSIASEEEIRWALEDIASETSAPGAESEEKT